jgi:hypothetical protein
MSAGQNGNTVLRWAGTKEARRREPTDLDTSQPLAEKEAETMTSIAGVPSRVHTIARTTTGGAA